MKGKGDVAFTVGLGLVGLWMVYQAWEWPFSAKLAPTVMGIAFLLLVGLLGITFLIKARAPRGPEEVAQRIGAGKTEGARARPAGTSAAPPTDTGEPSVRAYAVHGAWLGIFMLAVWVLGFSVGGTVSVAAYLIYARTHWLTIVTLTLGAAGIVWSASVWMQIRFPDPLLW